MTMPAGPCLSAADSLRRGLPREQRPAFEPARPGTAEEDWQAILQDQPTWTPRPGPLLVVSPHPDDEILGAGGLIREWSQRGFSVAVVSVTDGEAAFPEWDGLGDLRQRELRRALDLLAPQPIPVIRLGIPDGDVASRAPGLRNALIGLCDCHPTIVSPYDADGHPDHEAVAAECRSVAASLRLPIARYPIWAWHHGEPARLRHARWARFSLDASARAAKWAAVQCFTSQIDPGVPRQPVVPAHVLEYFKRDFEAFLV